MILSWRARRDPLEPRAVCAVGRAARALAAAALARSDEALGALCGVASEDAIVLLGDSEALPWADGVGYLGVDPEAPSLLVPTALAPSIPLALLERAALRIAETAPIAVLLSANQFLAVGSARPVARAALEAARKRLP
ncbi:MAG: hypothetical protein HOV80_09365 [Polyangiaceae bacterium]|nr:hypothetical protein [Polyangiaceae bacterium]